MAFICAALVYYNFLFVSTKKSKVAIRGIIVKTIFMKNRNKNHVYWCTPSIRWFFPCCEHLGQMGLMIKVGMSLCRTNWGTFYKRSHSTRVQKHVNQCSIFLGEKIDGTLELLMGFAIRNTVMPNYLCFVYHMAHSHARLCSSSTKVWIWHCQTWTSPKPLFLQTSQFGNSGQHLLRCLKLKVWQTVKRS